MIPFKGIATQIKLPREIRTAVLRFVSLNLGHHCQMTLCTISGPSTVMSIAQLPDGVLTSFFNEYLCARDMCKLDSSCCNKVFRTRLLNIFNNEYCLIKDRFDCTYHADHVMWIYTRRLAVVNLYLSQNTRLKIIDSKPTIKLNQTKTITVDRLNTINAVELVMLINACPKLSTFPVCRQAFNYRVLSQLNLEFFNNLTTMDLSFTNESLVDPKCSALVAANCRNLTSVSLRDRFNSTHCCDLVRNNPQLVEFEWSPITMSKDSDPEVVSSLIEQCSFTLQTVSIAAAVPMLQVLQLIDICTLLRSLKFRFAKSHRQDSNAPTIEYTVTNGIYKLLTVRHFAEQTNDDLCDLLSGLPSLSELSLREIKMSTDNLLEIIALNHACTLKTWSIVNCGPALTVQSAAKVLVACRQSTSATT